MGPEGGFEEGRGRRSRASWEHVPSRWAGVILRTETAGLTILSILMYHLESSV
ncbi:MAG: hypothetical protein ACLTT1_17035 [[Clostridium] scindens]